MFTDVTETRNWSRPRTSGIDPGERYGHILGLVSIDTATHFLIVFGGDVLDEHLYTMRLTGNSWTDLVWNRHSVENPLPLVSKAAVCCYGNRMFVHGGRSFDGKEVYNDLYMIEIGLEEQIVISKLNHEGERPSRRHSHTMAYLPHKNVLLIHGGANEQGKVRKDVWVYLFDEKKWKRVESQGWTSRYGHSWTPILNGTRLAMIGGLGKTTFNVLEYHVLNTNQIVYEGCVLDSGEKDQLWIFDATSEFLSLPDEEGEEASIPMIKLKGTKRNSRREDKKKRQELRELNDESKNKENAPEEVKNKEEQSEAKIEISKEYVIQAEFSDRIETTPDVCIDVPQELSKETEVHGNNASNKESLIETQESLKSDTTESSSFDLDSSSVKVDTKSPITKIRSQNSTRRRSQRVTTAVVLKPSSAHNSGQPADRLNPELLDSMDNAYLKTEVKTLIYLVNQLYSSVDILFNQPPESLESYRQGVINLKGLFLDTFPKLNSYPLHVNTTNIMLQSREMNRKSMDFAHSAEREILKLKGKQNDNSLPEGCEDNEKNAFERGKAIIELIDTERTYIKNIETIIDSFLAPLDMKGILSEKDIQIIFSNLKVILPFNKEFLSSLEQMKDLSSHEQTVGGVFLAMADYLKMYTVYCTSQNQSVVRLQELFRNDGMFQRFIEDKSASLGRPPNEIFSLLIQPIQRVCRYPLLLRQIFKCTPSTHPDFENLYYAIAKVDQVVGAINEGKRRIEDQMKMLEIDQSLTWEKKIPIGFQFIDPSRKFLEEVEATLISRSSTHVILYLFNDILLLGKATSGSKRSVKNIIPLLRLYIAAKSEKETQCVMKIKKKTVTLSFEDQDVRDRWVTKIRETSDALNTESRANLDVYECLTGDVYRK